MLKVKNLSKKYPGNDRYSAHNIRLSVEAGQVVGLVGSNGAGKSTIIKSIIGVLPFQEGTIKIGGFDIVKQSEQAKKLIGYVPDDHSVYEKLTGREYINYMGSLYGATKEQKQFAVTELAEKFDNELYSSDQPCKWTCSNCGHSEEKRSAWQQCPLCSYPQGYVEIPSEE